MEKYTAIIYTENGEEFDIERVISNSYQEMFARLSKYDIYDFVALNEYNYEAYVK